MGEEKRKEKPLTRDDVLRLIKENGGKAEGLDLSDKVFEKGIDLRGLDLEGIILKKAILHGANLKGTRLSFANLEEADLFEANLDEANLFQANCKKADFICVSLEKAWLANANLEEACLADSSIDGADLYCANLSGATLANTSFSSETHLWKVDWGNYILREEKDRDTVYFAEKTYRELKIWYTNVGMHDIAAKFYYREKEVNRKSSKWRSKSSFMDRLASEMSRLFFGYGER